MHSSNFVFSYVYEQSDIVTYFDDPHTPIPELDALQDHATKLHSMFSSRRNFARAMDADNVVDFPEGLPWVPPAGQACVEGFLGDQTFARVNELTHDLIVCREMSLAVAQGDVGRVWEALKVRLAICPA
jgi:hypothetical protein